VVKLADFVWQEDIMAFSEAFLAWEQEVINRGRQKGLQEIRQEIETEMVLKMLHKQLDLETIAEFTGLPIEQIQQLQSQAATN
jgi:predicted transposase/invertase (TIGR01784 family)